MLEERGVELWQNGLTGYPFDAGQTPPIEGPSKRLWEREKKKRRPGGCFKKLQRFEVVWWTRHWIQVMSGEIASWFWWPCRSLFAVSSSNLSFFVCVCVCVQLDFSFYFGEECDRSVAWARKWKWMGWVNKFIFIFFLSSILAKEWVYKIAKATDFNETQLTLSIGEKKREWGGIVPRVVRIAVFYLKMGGPKPCARVNPSNWKNTFPAVVVVFFQAENRENGTFSDTFFLFLFPFSFWIFFSFVFPFFFKFISTIIEMVEKSNPNCLQRQCWTSREQSSMIGFSRVID